MSRTSVNQDEPAVLLIDGRCLLCNRITIFVAKRDKAKAFRFAMLQSSVGIRLLINGKLSTHDYDTFVMVQDGRYYTKSDAALRVLRRLGGWWRLMYLFIALPRAWRNVVYDFVANNRYKWFGQTDVCMLPSPELIARFIEDGVQVEGTGELPDEK
ncbi:thiol-disulfide oxidoreductase DCC family protein [Bacillus sp. FJAT-26390]|uniref:thiol-disulfide oxidoreductase DCC family protein n=1 Tax=Bacillus sp. FJAT-26390 TaxID=1743142 RepID=UPI000807FDE5|nr:thiol-disulfide oxidoreductase DCC family protein [Bacillus sp. FJAT-26390]OBZ17349.1 hypothetical protein A7975_05605 [Bacillus sp. FJAT-26390]